MVAYTPVIGLEVHVQLATQTKLFCSCPNQAIKDEKPNSRTCPICTGHPGTLPVLNKQVLEFAVKTGLALNCAINPKNVFARKNYFYPDLPKGFQISQYDKPICEYGYLEIDQPDGSLKRIGIRRIHLEEDAGKNTHFPTHSSVDLNRAGTPLIEIVSNPEISTSAEAVSYLKALHAIVTCLGVCHGNLQEGNFRCDANVSVMPVGSTVLGTRTELKNINSFKFVEKAIEYEIARQIEALNRGEKIIQETRGYDSVKNTTFSMRSKEEAHDYRYFPEPDLMSPARMLPLQQIPLWKDALPELPRHKRARLTEMGLSTYDAGVISASLDLSRYLDQALDLAHQLDPQASPLMMETRTKNIVNCLTGEVSRLINEGDLSQSKLLPQHIVDVVREIQAGSISHQGAKQVIALAWETGKAIRDLIQEHGLQQLSDNQALQKLVQKVLASHPEQVLAYRSGKEKLLSFFIGQMMKETAGKANPQMVKDLVLRSLRNED